MKKQRIAITGGTGFVGRHLARALVARGHTVALIARGVDVRDPDITKLDGADFFPIGTADLEQLKQAFAGCDFVAHCAGINRELQPGDYQRVHVQGTANVLAAAADTCVRKIVLLSFLRARPACGSPYHESKWAAEELVRQGDLDYTILKSGMIYGRGDHMLDHLSHTLHTVPLFGAVGFREKPICPVAMKDVVRIIMASLLEGRLSRQTVAVRGPEMIALSEAVRRVGKVIGKPPLIFPMPVAAHCAMAIACERLMKVPLVSLAQIRMLSEGFAEPGPGCDPLPEDLMPDTPFTEESIREGLPAPGPFTAADLR